jgi:hypothetical protein
MAATIAENSLPSGSGLTFEKVWAMFQETAKRMQETDRRMQETDRRMQETDRRMQETDRQIKETDRQMKETDRRLEETGRLVEETGRSVEETSRQMKETGRRLGYFDNRFGEILEYMVAPNLREKFMELGFVFPKANNNTEINDHKNNIHFQIDIMLENGDKAMLVEVKSKFTIKDVNDHIARLQKMRVYADLHDDKRSFLGAVAGVIMRYDVKKYALRQGFFAVEPAGETLNITSPQGQLKEW